MAVYQLPFPHVNLISFDLLSHLQANVVDVHTLTHLGVSTCTQLTLTSVKLLK